MSVILEYNNTNIMQQPIFLQNLLELLVNTSVWLISFWIKLDDWFLTPSFNFTDVDDCLKNLSDSDWVLKFVIFEILFD